MNGHVNSPFAIIPWQVASDDRLNKRHLKVIIALLSFRSRDTGLFWATRDQIAERCGLRATRISEVTAELEQFGWLRKEGKGGSAVRYSFTVPADLLENHPQNGDGTQIRDRTQNGDGPRNGDGNGPRNGDGSVPKTGTVPSPKRGHSDTHTETQKETQLKPKPAREKRALPDWLPEELWRDWVEYRKGGKSRFTEKAEALSLRTLTKLRDAGHEPRRVIELAIERGWTGLFAPRDDAVSARGSPGKPAIAQQFSAKTYTGTADNELPLHLRA